MAGDNFDALYTKITSAVPDELTVAAATWRGFAAACRAQAGKAGQDAQRIAAPGTSPHVAAGDRLTPIGARIDAIAGKADAVSEQLARAGDVGSQARMEAHVQKAKVEQLRAAAAQSAGQDTGVQPNGAATGTTNAPVRMRELAEREAAAVLQKELQSVTAAYNAFQPQQPAGGDAGSGGGGGGAPGGGSGSAGGGAAGGGGAVTGAAGGDFPGWVTDPRNGQLIDPATGQVFDPQTGRYIDPLTGRPFGEVQQYASRLEGLAGGTSLSGGGGGGPLHGGHVPPSMDPANPAAAQLQQRAAAQMAANAAAAQQLTARHPYLPPMNGAMGGAGGGVSRGRPRYLTDARSIWGGHPNSARKQKAAGQPNPRHWASDDEVWSAGVRIYDDLLQPGPDGTDNR